MSADAYAREPRWDPSRFPPASRAPRAVQTTRMFRDPLGYALGLRARFGPVFTMRVFPQRAGLVCAASAETSRQVLTDQARFVGGAAAALLAPVVGPGSLICTPPPRHLRNRKLLLPPFHGERVARWTERVRELVDTRLPELATGAPVAVRPWAQALTLDVILRVVFGLEDPPGDRRLRRASGTGARVAQFRAALDRFMATGNVSLLFAPRPLQRDLGPLSPGGAFARKRAAVDALIAEEVAARRQSRDRDERDDVLSVLLDARDEEGIGLTDAELRDELMGLVLAGHETTATALAWTLHLLAHHPAARDALVDDLDAGSDTLLKATIDESLRLRPPVFDAVRIATDDTELAGRPVPKDAFVSAMFCLVHLDAELWPQPHAFRPERHVDGGGAPYALTPFGGGVRRCIGASLAQLELEIVLRGVLEGSVPEPAGELEPARLFSVTIVPARGGRVRLVPRSHPARTRADSYIPEMHESATVTPAGG